MKAPTFLIPALSLTALAAVFFSPVPSQGEIAPEEAAVATVLAELAAQQAVIVENQTKIDAKVAAITENVRVARIFVSRGGGKSK